MEILRSYALVLDANPVKLDTARYTYERHLKLVNLWTGKLLFNGNKSLSTYGLGKLASQAQHRARGVIQALKASAKETGNKVNVPVLARVGCPAKIEESENSFDYWLTVEHEFEKAKRVALPVKSHRKFNDALKNGWVLNPVAEFFKDRNGRFYARVFVSKEVKKAEPRNEFLGCDVGYRNGVARSDGYIGKNTGKIIRLHRVKNAERRRQNHKVNSVKTFLKQLLDIEARRAVNVSLRDELSLVVESPKTLANLRSGKLQGWARCYFYERCRILSKEQGVFMLWVNPAYTSQTCSVCGLIDGKSREKSVFKCTSCKSELHADVNAAVNISRKGSESIVKMRSGSARKS